MGISNSFAFAGFYDLSKRYAHKALEINHYSIACLIRLAYNGNWTGNFDRSIELCLYILKLDPQNRDAKDRLAYNYMLTGAYEKAYTHYKMIEPADWMHVQNNIQRFAHVYREAGNKEESEVLFKFHEDILLSIIEPGRAGIFTYYDLAGIYAFQGKKEEAPELLYRVKHYKRPNDWFVTLISMIPSSTA